MADQQPYFTIRSRQPADRNGAQTNGTTEAGNPRSATHDISRTSFHVKSIGAFAKRLEDSATRAFPNRGRSSQRYKKVQALLLHWGTDDLFVLPELEDLEKCLREDFAFGTDIFAIPSENSHLELMMRLGQLIKEYESQDTLFLIYYGGHARIDESRQSTWCATRDQDSAWLQWSAIQTLLERSKSDVLILLDCCAGAASATFPNGNSITETISASSWDTIAPDPGRYSFTNALIEVLQEWRLRTFSAAMLHAEVLARLKHPRPITINGKHFEARSTPVHFMMTANHKAPSIELSRVLPPEKIPDSQPSHPATPPLLAGRAAGVGDVAPTTANEVMATEPDEDTPHVMISLALEDDQRLDINAWEQWLSAFPAMAKYVKVQGVFKSHSNLLLISVPVMVWDLLPDDPAVSFVAFIRSNNLAIRKHEQLQPRGTSATVTQLRNQRVDVDVETASIATGVSGTTTFVDTDGGSLQQPVRASSSYWAFGRNFQRQFNSAMDSAVSSQGSPSRTPPSLSYASLNSMRQQSIRPIASSSSLSSPPSAAPQTPQARNPGISRQMILNQQQSMRRKTFGDDVPEAKKFSAHVERRLEEYYQHESEPNDAQSAFLASNLGVELWHLEVWFHHRREKDSISNRLATMGVMGSTSPKSTYAPTMILPADLNHLLGLSLQGTTMIFDLRPSAEYERSHIYGAINLRAPRSFLRSAPLATIERSIPDEQGRKQLSQCGSAQCIVFYSRGLEFTWECPAAEIISRKLRQNGWTGQCFILRGHFREFSQTFDKYIVGFKMTQNAKDWIRNRQMTASTSKDDLEDREALYSEWLSHVEAEDRARPLEISPEQSPDRFAAFESQEKHLETEFQAQYGQLYGKAMNIGAAGTSMSNTKDGDGFDAKAGMVEYLDRGLDKVRMLQDDSSSLEPLPPSQSNPIAYAPGHSKIAREENITKRSEEHQDFEGDYVQVTGTEEPGQVTSSSEATRPPRGGSSTAVENRQRGSGGSLLNKMFRR